MRPIFLPLHQVYFPGQEPSGAASEPTEHQKQDPEVVHSRDFVNERLLWLCDLDKLFYPSGPYQ